MFLLAVAMYAVSISRTVEAHRVLSRGPAAISGTRSFLYFELEKLLGLDPGGSDTSNINDVLVQHGCAGND